MELLARTLREGEPVAAAYGCTREGQAIRAGLLLVAERLTETELDFVDPETQETARLKLPAKTLDMPQDGYLLDILLEAVCA